MNTVLVRFLLQDPLPDSHSARGYHNSSMHLCPCCSCTVNWTGWTNVPAMSCVRPSMITAAAAESRRSSGLCPMRATTFTWTTVLSLSAKCYPSSRRCSIVVVFSNYSCIHVHSLCSLTLNFARLSCLFGTADKKRSGEG